MAKEMMIIFVYDTQMLQKEDDDPSSAILYFHPSWVSDQQKTALCGQLIGTVHCVKSIFAAPKIVSLQSGKFFVKEYGRYLMAVGTDRNVADWLLEHRANTMASIISFFHQDIEIMAQNYGNSAKLTTKLYQLFETYLKYLFLGGNIFSYLPAMKLPKSASNVFLEAIQILQCCQEHSHVLGGTLLYHNKVVATQLNSDITKRIVLTDPYRIKCPAELPDLNFDLPIGVQLYQVYIPTTEYHRLHNEATRSRNIFQFLNNKTRKKAPSYKEPVISAMKRDQSIIFTAVPEESEHCVFQKPNGPKVRPKFLNLKNKTSDFTSAIEKKPAVGTPFLGQTSVCSTPMTDLSKVVHSKPLSICTNPAEKSNKKLSNGGPAPFTKNAHRPKKFNSMTDLSITKYFQNDETIEKQSMKQRKTIADPSYPIFRPDGTLVSHPLYKDLITNEMELITNELEGNQPIGINEKNAFDDFDSIGAFVKSVAAKTIEPVGETIEITQLVPQNQRVSKEHRKSLTLPLKSLNIENGEVQSPVRRHSQGVLLTPLMSKLSTFSNDDRSSGFCSRDATPLFTPTHSFPFVAKKPQAVSDGALQKCVLFVCGQQDMVVAILMMEEACGSKEVVNKLWDICTENLGTLEKQLHHCLETYPGGGGQSDSEPYSYLCLDPDWDTLHRGGPWGSAELGALTHFHRDFKERSNLTEILMRCCDGVIYGYKCGQSEVYYHQAANSNAGLPTPADPMGTVPLKTRRRLERDHSIILL